jgi:hypothetical protein
MKKKKYLLLYEKWVKSGKLPGKRGLCREFKTYPIEIDDRFWKAGKGDNELFVLMHPRIDIGLRCYWGGEIGIFTTFRQNIVLFMAAMNGEL